MAEWTIQQVALTGTQQSGSVFYHAFNKLCEVPAGEWYFQFRIAPANRTDWYYYCVAVCEQHPESNSYAAPGEFQSVQLFDGIRWGSMFVRGPAWIMVAQSNADVSIMEGAPDTVIIKNGISPRFMWRLVGPTERPPFTAPARYYYLRYLDAAGGLLDSSSSEVIRPNLTHQVAAAGAPTSYAYMGQWTYSRLTGVYLRWRTAPAAPPADPPSIYLSPIHWRRATGAAEGTNFVAAADPAAWAANYRGTVVGWTALQTPPDLLIPTEWDAFNPAGNPDAIFAAWLHGDVDI